MVNLEVENERMFKRIILKLTSARFLIAIMLTVTLCYLAIMKQIKPDVFVPICTLSIGYYFNKDKTNKDGDNE